MIHTSSGILRGGSGPIRLGRSPLDELPAEPPREPPPLGDLALTATLRTDTSLPLLDMWVSHPGVIYGMTSAQLQPSVGAVIAGVGAEDSFVIAVSEVGQVQAVDLTLTNTAAGVPRWLSLVLETNEGVSDVVVIEIQVNT